jgi:hypothetical protein
MPIRLIGRAAKMKPRAGRLNPIQPRSHSSSRGEEIRECGRFTGLKPYTDTKPPRTCPKEEVPAKRTCRERRGIQTKACKEEKHSAKTFGREWRLSVAPRCRRHGSGLVRDSVSLARASEVKG